MTRFVPKKKEFKRSQKWTQVLINDKSEFLNKLISKELHLKKYLDIQWLSPLESDCYAEYRGSRSSNKKDCAFLDILEVKLDKVGLEHFWPELGPQWDALGKYNNQYYFIVESKAYPEEMNTSCGAGEESKLHIKRSLDCTKLYLEVVFEKDWLNNYYQCANRLAHLFFLRVLNKNPVYLLFINFLNDPEKPTTLKEWEQALLEVSRTLGFGKGHNLEKYILNLYIDVTDF